MRYFAMASAEASSAFQAAARMPACTFRQHTVLNFQADVIK